MSYLNNGPTRGLRKLADAIGTLTWAEMADFAEIIASEVPHLAKSEKLDRDGVAQMLFEFAREIEKHPDPTPSDQGVEP